VRSVRAPAGQELGAVASLHEALRAEPELVILFGDAIRGESVRRLVDFGDSLGIPVQYVCLVDYANSRGAADMGLLPDLLPGYRPVAASGSSPGLTLLEILASPDLEVLWVVGANPLARWPLASEQAFVVVQDLFLTETAARADVVLPAACAYEKTGTVTNTCGEVQRLRKALETPGTKTDLEIFGLLARQMGLDLGAWRVESVWEEIQRNVPGYNVPSAVLAAGGAAPTYPVNGRIGVNPRPELIRSAGDTLFTSGTLGRYSRILNSVPEAPGALYRS
jgi:NADH-quinone oxidoreductase subunit G